MHYSEKAVQKGWKLNFSFCEKKTNWDTAEIKKERRRRKKKKQKEEEAEVVVEEKQCTWGLRL